jgi:hypothetical protein
MLAAVADANKCSFLVAPAPSETDLRRLAISRSINRVSKKRRKRTPEERERWAANQRRLEELIEKRLERDGTTREQIRRELGWPDSSAR